MFPVVIQLEVPLILDFVVYSKSKKLFIFEFDSSDDINKIVAYDNRRLRFCVSILKEKRDK